MRIARGVAGCLGLGFKTTSAAWLITLRLDGRAVSPVAALDGSSGLLTRKMSVGIQGGPLAHLPSPCRRA